jgi:hypothetical protein
MGHVNRRRSHHYFREDTVQLDHRRSSREAALSLKFT